LVKDEALCPPVSKYKEEARLRGEIRDRGGEKASCNFIGFWLKEDWVDSRKKGGT